VTVAVDASVVLKWYVAEADSAAARSLFVSEQDVIAPERRLIARVASTPFATTTRHLSAVAARRRAGS
jgi:predicted nucleic acid-binding protein